MKPSRIVNHRTHSALASCPHYVSDLETPNGLVPMYCGQPMVLYITNSPVRAYEFLVVQRCPEHIDCARGVLGEPAPKGWWW